MRLNLAWNGLGERGAEAVGEVLSQNRTLQFLDLSSNRILQEGAAKIAEGLRSNPTLRSLQLNGNPIGDKVAPLNPRPPPQAEQPPSARELRSVCGRA